MEFQFSQLFYSYNVLFVSICVHFILLASAGYLYHRQPWKIRKKMSSRISQKIFDFCNNHTSVTAELAKEPNQEPLHIASHLYGGDRIAVTQPKGSPKQGPASPEEIQRARECGDWGGAEPSDLFLQCFHAALCSLEHDPLAGMVSPSLMGSNGVLPVTVMAPVPDICRHMANVIVRAKKEVFLATNFWIASGASSIITEAIKELSRRAGERGDRAVVKIMYDRGNIKQIVDNHQMMSEKQYTAPAVKLPSPDEIPHIDMEVQNYHRPMLGTFHSKFMIVDRRIGIVQSNNIQDNDNLEMMTHIEGSIVDSLYDTAMLSWSRHFKPPLPCLDRSAQTSKDWMFNDPSFLALFDENGELKVPKQGFRKSDLKGNEQSFPLPDKEHRSWEPDLGAEIERMQVNLSAGDGESRVNAVTRHLSKL